MGGLLGLLVIVCVAMLLGLIPASIAQSKGKSHTPWWVFGTLLFIVALPMAILEKPDAEGILQASPDLRKCPFCAELIKREATVCRYCGREVPVVAPPEPTRLVRECPSCGTPFNPYGTRLKCKRCKALLPYSDDF